MSKVVLTVKKLSKQYRLGFVGTGSLKDDLKRFIYKIQGKDDPFATVGAESDRSVKTDEDYVWALQDITFDVYKGDVLGIIGRNGAGKSTLLKILSRVTSPTHGSVKSKGRIASLLEVGTGFHSELTGKENIFLNGAILGMSKFEIEEKLDEIIEFSGCALYIDTPVKRYSSGMRVRLAFAVAAHLEPDILVIDEVLAVGDAEFQKRAVGKMQEISKGEGRTVIFVSHNMASVKSLCTRSIVLQNGKIVFDGEVDEAVQYYLSAGNSSGSMTNRFFHNDSKANNADFEIKQFYIKAENKDIEEPMTREDKLRCVIEIFKLNASPVNIIFKFKYETGEYIFAASKRDPCEVNYGVINFELLIPRFFFNEGNFFIDLIITSNRIPKYVENDCLQFVIIQEAKKLGEWMGKSPGPIKPNFDWKVY